MILVPSYEAQIRDTIVIWWYR